MSNLARIEHSPAVLTQEVRNLRSDVSGLRYDLNVAQREYRDEIKALRGDLALSTSRQNSALSDAKKTRPDGRHVQPG